MELVKESEVSQKYLVEKGLIGYIAFLSAFIPLSTDLYLPSLPKMAENFNVANTLVNLTLVLFFIFFALGTLVWGPLSDKYGRRPILIIGMIIYTVASLLCALSGNVYQLIVFRVLQAIGSGSAVGVATALVKDVYHGKKRVSVLALVQSMAMTSPIIAPVIGAFILQLTSWRGVFFILFLVGVIAVLLAFALEETLAEKNEGNVFESISRIKVVSKNPGFIYLVLIFSIIGIPGMSFISASSYIYVDSFNLSEQTYSYFFAFNAVFFVIGPLIYIRLANKFKSNSIITACYIVTAVSGVLVATLGTSSPWLFAASLMSCLGTIIGSIGMLLISFDWGNIVIAMGIMYAVIAIISLVMWINIHSKPFIKQVEHHN
ncbi:MAG: Bcr/CflA family efflux MFS transporter [Clostridiaceae bacterium]